MFRIGFTAADRYTPRVSQQLNGRQRTFLRALAHHLEPVVQIGRSGATPAVLAQIAEQLLAHELIKVKFGKEAPEAAAEACGAIATTTKSLVVQTAGRVLTLYRRHDTKPKIKLPGSSAEDSEESDSDAKEKRDPKKSLNRLHAAKRARTSEAPTDETATPLRRGRGLSSTLVSDTATAPRRGRGQASAAAGDATDQKPGKRSVLSRLRAPRAGNAAGRAKVTARRRTGR